MTEKKEHVVAPTTMEGHYALHFAYAVDWLALRALDADTRGTLIGELVAWLEQARSLEEGSSAVFSLLGGKGDLFVFHLRPTLDEVNQTELSFRQLAINAYLTETYSYVSVTELASHGNVDARHAAVLKERGLEPDTDEWSLALEALQEEHEEFLQARLRPKIKSDRYICFYPMSKKRGEEVNWYRLTGRERGAMMRDHAVVGRKYLDRVTQLVTGSIGFDDWEWGVTLYASDPIWFKKLIYEMRYDRASADYALFGPFYLGIQVTPADLPQLLSGTLPRA